MATCIFLYKNVWFIAISVFFSIQKIIPISQTLSHVPKPSINISKILVKYDFGILYEIQICKYSFKSIVAIKIAFILQEF